MGAGGGKNLGTHPIWGLVRREDMERALGRRWKNAEKAAKM